MKGENNLWLYNISKPTQFLLLLIYFTTILNLTKLKVYILLLTSAVISAIFIYSNFHAKKNKDFNSLEEVVLGAIITALCIMYFHSVIRAKDPINLTLSEFWYCSSLFIFFGVSLCINGSLDFFIKNNLPLAQRLFYGLVINSYIFYVLIIYALVSNYKTDRPI